MRNSGNRSSTPNGRRRFVKLGITALAAVGAGSSGALAFRNRESVAWHWDKLSDSVDESTSKLHRALVSVEDRIQNHFDYLNIDEGGLKAFAQQHQRRYGEGFDSEPDSELFERFLLSTDFFQHSANESRLVKYVSYYDPYVSPCYNPCRTL